VSRYDLRQTSYIDIFFLLGDAPASEFCADVSENSVTSSFEPNLYLYVYTLTISSQLFFLLTPPMKMQKTECSETSAHKFRRRRITQKKVYNIHNTAKA